MCYDDAKEMSRNMSKWDEEGRDQARKGKIIYLISKGLDLLPSTIKPLSATPPGSLKQQSPKSYSSQWNLHLSALHHPSRLCAGMDLGSKDFCDSSSIAPFLLSVPTGLLLSMPV
ncbi:mCG147801 [Mus musculus]|nr:mCG147801 [Mus musculus]